MKYWYNQQLTECLKVCCNWIRMIDVEKKLVFKKVKVRPRVILRYVIASLETAFTGF